MYFYLETLNSIPLMNDASDVLVNVSLHCGTIKNGDTWQF